MFINELYGTERKYSYRICICIVLKFNVSFLSLLSLSMFHFVVFVLFYNFHCVTTQLLWSTQAPQFNFGIRGEVSLCEWIILSCSNFLSTIYFVVIFICLFSLPLVLFVFFYWLKNHYYVAINCKC